MTIPQIQNLVDQTYKANQIEFTWRLPHQDAPTLQIVLEVNNRGVVQLHQNNLVQDKDGDYIATEDGVVHKFQNLEVFEKKLSWLKSPEYDKFTNGMALLQLAKEVVEYLK